MLNNLENSTVHKSWADMMEEDDFIQEELLKKGSDASEDTSEEMMRGYLPDVAPMAFSDIGPLTDQDKCVVLKKDERFVIVITEPEVKKRAPDTKEQLANGTYASKWAPKTIEPGVEKGASDTKGQLANGIYASKWATKTTESQNWDVEFPRLPVQSSQQRQPREMNRTRVQRNYSDSDSDSNSDNDRNHMETPIPQRRLDEPWRRKTPILPTHPVNKYKSYNNNLGYSGYVGNNHDFRRREDAMDSSNSRLTTSQLPTSSGQFTAASWNLYAEAGSPIFVDDEAKEAFVETLKEAMKVSKVEISKETNTEPLANESRPVDGDSLKLPTNSFEYTPNTWNKYTDAGSPIFKNDEEKESFMVELRNQTLVESVVAPIEKKVEYPIERKIESDIEKVEYPIEKVEYPIEKVEYLIEKIESPIEKVESPIEKVESPIEKVESPIEKIEAPIEKVEAPIEKVESPIEKVESPIKNKAKSDIEKKIEALVEKKVRPPTKIRINLPTCRNIVTGWLSDNNKKEARGHTSNDVEKKWKAEQAQVSDEMRKQASIEKTLPPSLINTNRPAHWQSFASLNHEVSISKKKPVDDLSQPKEQKIEASFPKFSINDTTRSSYEEESSKSSSDSHLSNIMASVKSNTELPVVKNKALLDEIPTNDLSQPKIVKALPVTANEDKIISWKAFASENTHKVHSTTQSHELASQSSYKSDKDLSITLTWQSIYQNIDTTTQTTSQTSSVNGAQDTTKADSLKSWQSLENTRQTTSQPTNVNTWQGSSKADNTKNQLIADESVILKGWQEFSQNPNQTQNVDIRQTVKETDNTNDCDSIDQKSNVGSWQTFSQASSGKSWNAVNQTENITKSHTFSKTEGAKGLEVSGQTSSIMSWQAFGQANEKKLNTREALTMNQSNTLKDWKSFDKEIK
ncbi:hypothetical protein BDF14DRAFT_1776997 [Spinellus fusiger]|nr:hypothetical protein BDF14DRAFT_1776997 [Spinellus fusiger]